MKKTAVLFIFIFIFSSCNSATGNTNSSNNSVESISSSSLSSTMVSEIPSETSSTIEKISVNPTEFKTEFSEKEKNQYIDILSNYGAMYDTAHDYFAKTHLSLFGYSWENIEEFDINRLLSWRIGLSFRDQEDVFTYPAEEFETLAMDFFDVTPEQMRNQDSVKKNRKPMYDPVTQSYGLEAFGWGPGADPEITLDSVDDSKEGFLSLYVTISYPTEIVDGEKVRSGTSSRQILTIEYQPDGGYHYISCVDNAYPITEDEESKILIDTDAEEAAALLSEEDLS